MVSKIAFSSPHIWELSLYLSLSIHERTHTQRHVHIQFQFKFTVYTCEDKVMHIHLDPVLNSAHKHNITVSSLNKWHESVAELKTHLFYYTEARKEIVWNPIKDFSTPESHSRPFYFPVLSWWKKTEGECYFYIIVLFQSQRFHSFQSSFKKDEMLCKM